MTARTRKPGPRGAETASLTLRQKALELLVKAPRQLADMKPHDLKSLLHELQVYQVELEMQNQELREARHDLELSRAEYASLYDHAPVGYLGLDQNGRIRRLNLKAAELLGRPRVELDGQALIRFIAEADRTRFQNDIRRAWDSDAQHVCELGLHREDGDSPYIHFECRKASIPDSGPQVLRISMTDISRRVRMEEELLINRRQLESALRASHCGIWYWPDMDRDEAWWSPELYQLLGYKDSAIRPSFDTFKSLLHPADRERVIRELDSRVRQGQSFDAEFRLRTRNGGFRWFHSQAQIIQSGRGGRHMAGLLQDVTDKHERDAALQQAKEKAEEADREKSRFLAAASHDLRQPLQSLSLYLGTLKSLDLTAEQAGILAKMRQSVQTMGLLLRTLLNISRLDAGIIEPEPVDFPVRELFEDILVTNEPAAAIRGLELRVHPSVCSIHGDRVLLQEIIQNFVSNALANTDRGGVLLGCRRRGDSTLLQVWDTGIGVPAGKLQVLLNPSAEMEPAQTRRGETIRAGLGLAIVRQIAGLLGCRVEAASRPGRGSVFAVEVPLAGAESRTRSGGRETHVAEAVAAAHDGHRLLLVDNDAAILDASRSAAAAAGCRLATAGSLGEALGRLRGGFVPDVIVCDLQLRRIPGDAVIRELREALGRDIPAILLTGDTSNPETAARALGRCRVLFKPVEFEVIARTAEEMLTG